MLKLLLFTALVIGNGLLIPATLDKMKHDYAQDFDVSVLIVACLNLAYLAWTLRTVLDKSRLGTLVNLWFDAKEHELRKRND
jgi:hypothetical protein